VTLHARRLEEVRTPEFKAVLRPENRVATNRTLVSLGYEQVGAEVTGISASLSRWCGNSQPPRLSSTKWFACSSSDQLQPICRDQHQLFEEAIFVVSCDRSIELRVLWLDLELGSPGCLQVLQMKPTNNAAERSIRPCRLRRARCRLGAAVATTSNRDPI
jgi:hypothetical protein